MSIPVCKFYSCNRNCKFGKHCRFLHSNSDQVLNISRDLLDHHEELEIVNPNNTSTPQQPLILSSQSIKDQDEVTVKTEDFPICGRTSDSTVHPLETPQNEANSNPLKNDKIVRTDEKAKIRPRQICSHFIQHGWCKFGKGCRFSHPQKNVPDQSNFISRNVAPRFQRKKELADRPKASATSNENIEAVTESVETQHKADVHQYQPKVRICKYFRSGYCYKGSKCPFLHNSNAKKIQGLKDQSNNEKPIRSTLPKIIKPPVQPQILSLVDIDQDGTDKYRQLDINFLQKRFPNCIHVDNTPTDDFVAELEFSPSDPDWPFDLDSFVLEITLVADYPKQVMGVKVPSDKQDLPETVRRSLELSIENWINNRHSDAKAAGKVELVARSFFKWLDKNLEDLMTDALTRLKRELTAKAHGMEFIPVEELKTRIQLSSANDAQVEDYDDDDEENDSSDECLSSDNESESEEYSSEDDKKYSLSTDKRGTEITLKHLQLKQNACALMLSKVVLMVQCSRCKTVSPVALDQTKVVAIECGKCGQEMMAKYRPSLAHALSSIVGYLDLENCVAFDLILQDSTLVVSCLACSKSTSIDGLVTGQVTDSWCKACNAKFKIATEAVKFYLLEPSTVITAGSKVEKIRSKTKKSVKDPAIREGFPLPDEGTCRHYKQSYRWLRFPCCGKAYPCDVCHDKKEDHMMDMATRMICGHCSREQNFSASRPCVSCNSHLTKIKSSHWEGGSGCRDKISMSRGDQQKYKNMNKTQSNHSKKVKASASGKKSTKLRHA